MSIIFGPGVGNPPLNTPPDTLPDSTPNDRLPVVVQLVPGQTGNLLEFRDTAGVVLSFIDSSGDFSGLAPVGAVTLTPATTARNTIQPTVDNAECLVLKAHSPTQSVRLMEWEKSDGTLIGGIGPGGSCIFKGFAVGANPKSANYVANGTDHYIPVDATAGPVTVTLPAAAVATPFGFQLQVAKVDATANTVTVQRAGADTFVGGGTSVSLQGQGDTAFAQSDGVSVWEVTTPAINLQAGNTSFYSINANGFQYSIPRGGSDGYRMDMPGGTGSHMLNLTSGDVNSFGNVFQVNDTGLGVLAKLLGSLNDVPLRILQFPGTTTDLVQLTDNASAVYWRMDSGWVQQMSAKSSTSVPQRVASFAPGFLDNTNATWKGRLTISTTDSAGDREVMRGEADGAAPRVGFLGASAVVRQTNGTAAALAAITDANAKSFITALSTALVNLGLLAAPA